MVSARFGLDTNCFAIVLQRRLRFSLGHQQVSQKLVSIGESGIGAQGSLQLALRFFEMAGAPKGDCIVVSSSGIVRPQPKGNLEMIDRLVRSAGSRKKSAQIA